MGRFGWIALLCSVLVGCQPSGTGGPLAEQQATRESLSDAYVHATQVHAEITRNRYEPALAALKEVRADLMEAKQTARLQTQARLNETDKAAIRAEQALRKRNARESYASTIRLVTQIHDLLVSMAPIAVPTPTARP